MNIDIAANVIPKELGSSGTSWQTDTKKILEKAGFNEKGLVELNTESLYKLLQLVSSEGTKAILTKRMFNAVASNKLDKLNSLIDILSAYKGNFSILGQFLNYLKESDPFVATGKAQIIILSASNLPSARGVSGVVHKGLVYCAYNTDQPTDSVGYFSKKQAITKIFEAFNPERLNFENRDKISRRRTSILREQLASADLAELVENPEAKMIASSLLISRNFEVYKELREAIKLCREQLAGLTYNGSLLLSAMKGVKVLDDPGRQLFGWFEEHIKENKNIPNGIRLAFESLKDPDIALTPEEEKDYLQGLLSYQRLHSYINKASALEPALSDLKEYKTLPIDSSLRLDARVESAEAMIKECIGFDNSEITLTEFGKLIELTGLVEFRRKMNQELFNIYKDDVNKALDLFSFVSFQNEKWREDSLDESVPMERLKQHLYGAKVGVSERHYGDDKKQATLTQKDFKAVADLQFLSRIIKDPEKFFVSMPIAKFRTMLHGVVVAYRKAMYLENKLTSLLTNKPELQTLLDREAIGNMLSDWKPHLLLGNGYLPSEVNIEKNIGVCSDVHSYTEIHSRVSDRSDLFIDSYGQKKEYFKLRPKLERVLKANLITVELSKYLNKFEEKIISLIPASLVQDKLNQATRVITNPLVVKSGLDTTKLLRSKYFNSEEISRINKLAELESKITQSSIGLEGELAELSNQAKALFGAVIFEGDVIESGKSKRLRLKSQYFNSFVYNTESSIGNDTLVYMDPQNLKSTLAKLTNDFISLKDLSNWVSVARMICSSQGRERLHAKGYTLVDDETFKCSRDLSPYASCYINKKFVDIVKEIAGVVCK